MTEPFIGEIRLFAGTFAPRGYSFCNGGTVPIDQNTSLFAILGTTFGGNGRTTVGLPDLQGRAPMGAGTGSGLTRRRLGEPGGTSTVTLNNSQVVTHNHTANGAAVAGNSSSPSGDVIAQAGGRGTSIYLVPDENTATVTFNSLGSTGNSEGHNNLQPLQVINFIIALTGSFPSRS